MKFSTIIKTGAKNLYINKMRTGLAMLGIIIGIGSVIALVSMGEASKKAVQDQIQSIGSNLLTISPGAVTSGGVRGAMGSSQTLTNDDAEAITNSETITTVAAVAPEYSDRSQVVAGKNNTNTQIVGVTTEYKEVKKISLSSGSFITQQQNNAMSKVAILGATVVEDLFGTGVDPIGETIRIDSKSFQVIGVMSSKGGSTTNNDDRILIPLNTAQKQLYGVKYLTSISVPKLKTK